MREEDKIEKILVNIAEMQKDISYVIDFIKSADKRYASKLTESLVYGLVGLILITVASAVVAGVIKAAEYLILRI